MSRSARNGLTLIEVLVVIAVIAVTIALLLPATRRVGGASQRTQCMSQLRQIGIALHTSQDAYGRMPGQGCQDYPWPAAITSAAPSWSPSAGNFQGSTLFYLLPFIDQTDMMQQWAQNAAVNSESSASPSVAATKTSSGLGLTGNQEGDPGTVARVPAPKLYVCPSDPSGPIKNRLATGPQSTYFGIDCPVANYAVNYQLFGLPKPQIPDSIPDGSSTTVMAYERYAICNGPRSTSVVMNPWGVLPMDGNSAAAFWSARANQEGGLWANFQFQPAAAECDSTRTQSMHTSGISVLMADASVKLVSPTVSQTTWHALVTPDGGDKVGPDW